MSSSPVVANASPLIALDRIGRLDLLRELFGRITIPPAVARETTPRLEIPAWIERVALNQPLGTQILGAALGQGESEAISLALESEARFLILDDLPARRLALAMRLPVIGTLAVLIHAKRRRLLGEVAPDLDRLVAQGFRISNALREQVLEKARENKP